MLVRLFKIYLNIELKLVAINNLPFYRRFMLNLRGLFVKDLRFFNLFSFF